jgi:hypothetical protein
VTATVTPVVSVGLVTRPAGNPVLSNPAAESPTFLVDRLAPYRAARGQRRRSASAATVTVTTINTAPVVSQGRADRGGGRVATLNGSASSDMAATARLCLELQSRPAGSGASIVSASSVTPAMPSIGGTYVLRLIVTTAGRRAPPTVAIST